MKTVLRSVAIASGLLCTSVLPLRSQGVLAVAPVQQAQPPRVTEATRAMLERRVQDRVNEIVRVRLALSDEQFQQLRALATRIEDDKRALRNDELTTRFSLRQELLAGDRVNEARVGELLDKMPKLERRRLDIMEAEQRDLSKFLSPSQRARYYALQDELRKNMQDMQRRRLGGEGDSAAPSLGVKRPLGAGRRLRMPPSLP